MTSSNGNLHDGTAPSIASWEKHTKGIGSKLLQKFGFKGRLGAKEDGISGVIEVQVRPTNVGLGFGEIETANQKVNQRGNHDKGQQTKQSLLGLEELDQSWQVNGSNNGKIVYEETHDRKRRKVTTESFLKNYEEFLGMENSTTRSTIIDMRSQDVKLIHDFHELTDTTMPDKQRSNFSVEVLYNLGKQLEVDTKRCGQEDQTILRIKEQIEDLRHLNMVEENRIKKIEKLKKVMMDINGIVELKSATGTQLEEVIQKIQMLYEESPKEFYSFDMIKVLPTIVEKFLCPLKDAFLEKPCSVGFMFKLWEELSHYFFEKGLRSVGGEVSSSFQHVVEREFLPITRRFFTSQWEPIQRCDQGVAILEVMKEILPHEAMQDMVDVVLIPRLSAAIQCWHIDMKYPLHSWILPWLPICASKLSPLYPDIRRKLLSCLKIWHAHDSSAVDLLSPWVSIFDGTSMEYFFSKAIIPKLLDYIQKDFVVNPANQCLKVIGVLQKWEPLLPSYQYRCLFAGEIIPKWLRTLVSWLLLPDCNFGEVCRWYEGWHTVFPPTVLSDEEHCLPIFKLALDLMKDVAEARLQHKYSDKRMDLTNVLQSVLRQVDYHRLIRKHIVDKNVKKKAELLQKNYLEYTLSTSLRDVIAMMAEKNDVDFKPKAGRQVEGKIVWEFGKSLCYIENNVIYSHSATTNAWLPITLEDLVSVSK